MIVSSSGAAPGSRPAVGAAASVVERADVAAEVERAGGVVPDVAEEPPAARGPARPVVEREDERARLDPGPAKTSSSCSSSGSGWRPPTAGSGPIAERSDSGSRWTAPGMWPCVVGGARPNVDEHGAHKAPRGATSSSSTWWSGNRARAPSRRRPIRRPRDHRRPGSREGRAARSPDGGARPDRLEHLRGPIRLVEPVSERGREEGGVTARRAGAEQSGPTGARRRLGVRHRRGQCSA